MTFAHPVPVLCALALMLPGVAAAQSGPVGPASSDLDLPVDPARLTTAPTEEEEEEEDPRDIPPPVIWGEEIPTENDTIIYVLDISCSMGWDIQTYTTADGQTARGPRIDRAKAELSRSIMGLAENFKFNVVAYDCSVRSWRSSLEEASAPNKQSAIGWGNALRPTGATGTGPATAVALGFKDNLSVVLLTDGAPNCGASGVTGHRTMIRAANTQDATVTVFGIAASGTYRAFCQGVAADNGGSYIDVP